MHEVDEKSESEDMIGTDSGPGRARPILPKSFTSAFEKPQESILSGRGSPGRYATTTTQPKPQPISSRHIYNPNEELRVRKSRSASKERSRNPSVDEQVPTPKGRFKQLDELAPPLSPSTSKAFGVYGEDASESELSD